MSTPKPTYEELVEAFLPIYSILKKGQGTWSPAQQALAKKVYEGLTSETKEST